ncbi:DUF559 domain-containing protein [Nakamurella silvestris]|nr:DUF559 domain-containing protein [Nakamurella silvestris]
MELTRLASTHGLESTIRLQDGLITRAQALAVGLNPKWIDRQVERGKWLRVLPGVYRHRGSDTRQPTDEYRARVRAVWLWAGPDSIVAMSAAAWWWHLQEAPPPVVEIWTPPRQRLRPQPGVRVRRRSLSESDTVTVDGIVVTTKDRTAVDISAAGSTDGLDSLARRGELDAVRLDHCLRRGSGSRGWVAARAHADNSLSNPWSVPERLLHQRLREAGLTRWVANEPITVGRRVRIPDIRLEDLPLVIEVDGREHHGTDDAFESDSERDAEYAAAGWTALRFTFRQIADRPDWVVATISATVERLVGMPVPRH